MATVSWVGISAAEHVAHVSARVCTCRAAQQNVYLDDSEYASEDGSGVSGNSDSGAEDADSSASDDASDDDAAAPSDDMLACV